MPDPLTAAPEPVNVTVPVSPLKVPLLVQLPPMLCEKLPPLNVVDAPRDTFPFTVIAEAAVNETEVPVPNTLLRLPNTDSPVPGKVFTAAPLELLTTRFP